MIELATLPSHNFLRSGERPLLARVADSVFWMARYVERSEHVARLLLVHHHLLTDVGDLAPQIVDRQWRDLLRVMHIKDEPTGDNVGEFVRRRLTFDASCPASLQSLIGRARENARSIRADISSEMWQSLNELYWATRGEEALSRFDDNVDAYLVSVLNASMLFQGLTDQTLAHDQRWEFAQLGKFLERVDVTCMVLETRHQFLSDKGTTLETPLRNIQLMAALRMCCSIEAFRRRSVELDLPHVALLLLLDVDHPRSVRFCVERAHRAAAGLRAATNTTAVDKAERLLGRLMTQLTYAEPEEVLERGITEYLHDIRSTAAAVGLALGQRYFLV